MTEIEKAFAALEPGGHACLAYADGEERTHIVAAFLRSGLERRERCIYAGPAPSREAVSQRLRTDGVDVAGLLQTGTLLLLEPSAIYAPGFEPARQAAVLADLIDGCRADGFAGFCGVGEAVYPIEAHVDPAALLAYEALADGVLRDRGGRALCLYDRGRTAAEYLLSMLTRHPLVVHEGRLCADHQLLARLGARNQVLGRAVQAREALLGVLSRQLRRPLPALRAQLESLLDDERLAFAHGELEAFREHLDCLGRVGERLATIVAFLGDAAPLTPEPLDLAALAEAAVAEVKADRRAPVDVRLAAVRPTQGSWDRERLSQLLRSLLAVAVDESWGTPVEVAVEPLGAAARVAVQYRSLESDPLVDAAGREEGSGPATRRDRLELELWISRELVRRMGGTLGVSAWADGRVTLRVDLPAREGPSPTSERPS